MIWDVYGIYFNGDDDDDYRWCWNPNICIQSPPQNWWYECFPASWTHCNICFNQPDFALRSALHYSIPFLLSHQIWCNICLIFPLLLLIRPTFNVISSGLAQFLYYFFFYWSTIYCLHFQILNWIHKNGERTEQLFY